MTRKVARRGRDRRGVALLMVMMVVSTLMIIGVLFSGSVTAEYRASVYYRQAVQSEQYCIMGIHRAMSEVMYDVWGVNENRPFVSARYDPAATGPEDNLLALAESAYYDIESGSLQPITRQRGFWNGEAWVVWAGGKVTDHGGYGNGVGAWKHMSPVPNFYHEKPGGAQRFRSYGDGVIGTVSCTNGSTVVTGDANANFNTAWAQPWPNRTPIWINGTSYEISAVGGAKQLTLTGNFAQATAAGLTYYVPGYQHAQGSKDSPQTLPGGLQSAATYIAANVGHMQDLRWVDPGQYIMTRSGQGAAWQWGGVDLNGDGAVTEDDKILRDWALWQLRRDAFLPEAMDNHDLFQAGLHANNRKLFSNGSATRDAGWEFIDPRLVGDSFYQVFRAEPIYTVVSEAGYDGYSPLDGAAKAGARDGKADKAGYRYPYDRTHLGRTSNITLDNDPTGSLVNINGCNNDYNTEQWCQKAPSGAPASNTWQHYAEAKWIYCYDPLSAERRVGRYAVTVQPDGGVWNANALHHGTATLCKWESPGTENVGNVAAAGGYPLAMRAGFHPMTGAAASAAFLQSNWIATAPIRPSPLPAYWYNGAVGAPNYRAYNRADDPTAFQVGADPVVDWTRGPHGYTYPWVESFPYGTAAPFRIAIFNYMIWLGPYDSRAEFATHMRKGALINPGARNPGDPTLLMEHCDWSEAGVAKLASDAQMLAANTTVQGYYYTLDRFWDRDLLVLDSAYGAAGGTDVRFATETCPRTNGYAGSYPQGLGNSTITPINFASAAALPGQQTRRRYIEDMRNLEGFGGYRTPDGSYKLMNYLFDADVALYDPDSGPAGHSPAPAYGGGGDIANPSTWNVQKRSSRMEKMMAVSAARHADNLRQGQVQGDGGTELRTAACARGHILNSPWLSAMHKPQWDGVKMTSQIRTDLADPTLDEIGMGCPVCGGKLFLAAPNAMSINEIGRFYERFRNAERPSRPGYDVGAADLTRRPARHFIELVTLHSSVYSVRQVLRMSRFGPWIQDPRGPGTGNVRWWWESFSGTLSDPATGSPYFTDSYEMDRRFRMQSEHTAFDTAAAEAIDPEPAFLLRIMVYDDTDANPVNHRWYDATQAIESSWCNSGGDGSYTDQIYYGDVVLLNNTYGFIADDGGSASANWEKRNIVASEKYVIVDPDPAHQQAAELGVNVWDGTAWSVWTGTAAVSLYRKMPVRWYGGHRHEPYDNFYTSPYDPSWWKDYGSPWTGGFAYAQPTLRSTYTGCHFGSGTWSSGRFANIIQLHATGGIRGQNGGDYICYAGDYNDPLLTPGPSQLGGWPGPTPRSWIGSSTYEDLGPGGNYIAPSQYGIVTFDGRFDGSKVAIVKHNRYGNEHMLRHQVVEYIELTDSVGNPIKISQACKPDPNSGNRTVLSWQARDPQEHRSNADGYMCWDLLPMTLHSWPDGLPTPYEGVERLLDTPAGVVVGNPADPDMAGGGYHPWPAWWGNELAGSNYHGGYSLTRPYPPQSRPPGYYDITARTTNSRNANMYHRDIPVRQSAFSSIPGSAITKGDARAEHLGLDRCDWTAPDGATPYWDGGAPLKYKEAWISVPTGVGRQANLGDTKDRVAAPATYSGRQHTSPDLAGKVWYEGRVESLGGTVTDQHKWSGYSWDRWSDVFKVSDLCERFLLRLDSVWEDRDIFDGDQDGRLDEKSEASLAYTTPSGVVASVAGRFIGELKQINKVNLNELNYPAMFGGTAWNTNYHSFARKPLRGFHSPSDMLTYNYSMASYWGPDNSYHLYTKRWDLDEDRSEDHVTEYQLSHNARMDPVHTSNSPVYTFIVTGNALDEAGEPLAEMRAKLTVERTWDGRCSILEFTWMPTERGFME
jgi:hypothetical protein